MGEAGFDQFLDVDCPVGFENTCLHHDGEQKVPNQN